MKNVRNQFKQSFSSILVKISEDDAEYHKVDLHDRQLTDADLDNLGTAVSQNTVITSLNIAHNAFTPNAICQFMEYVEGCVSLRELDLSDNDLSGDCLKCIWDACTLNGMVTLVMENAKITSKELSTMGDLRPDSHLVSLSLSGNNIGDEGFHYLLSCLGSVSTIQSLNLRNCGITEASIPDIDTFVKSHPSIREINIEGEPISEDSKADLLVITGYSNCSVLYTVSSSPADMEVESPVDSFQNNNTHLNCVPAWKTIQALHWYIQTTFPDMNVPLNNIFNLPMTQCNGVSQNELASQIRMFKNEMIPDPSEYYSDEKPSQNHEMIILFASNLPTILAALRIPSSFVVSDASVDFQLGSQLLSTIGQIPRCGQLRIDLVLLWATLVHLNPQGLSDFLVNEKVVAVILGLLDEYPWNSILHNACEVFLTEVILSMDRRVVQNTLSEMCLYSKLQKRIVGEIDQREQSGKIQCGFVGILLHLCRMMEESADKNHEYSEWLWDGQKKEGLTKEEEQKYIEFKLKNEEIAAIDESDGYDFSNI